MKPSRSLSFESDRFDFNSELPEEYNAGNRFYGKDVAAFLAEALTSRGVPSCYLDEDWGWLVLSTRDAEEDFEIAVYNLSEHRNDGRTGTNRWGLWLRQLSRQKVLGIFSKRVEVPVTDSLFAAVNACILESGAVPKPWEVDE